MKSPLLIGFTYDIKEDYHFHSQDWRHSDFSTLAEVASVKTLFEELGHQVFLIGNYEKLYHMLSNGKLPPVDTVFNIAEGINSRNREAWIPSLLEINHIPYSGSDAYGLSLTLNKLHMKIMAEHLGIRTAPYRIIASVEEAKAVEKTFPGPWVLKPNYEGSSSGVKLVVTEDDLCRYCSQLLQEYRQTILCEKYIEGREFNVALLNDGEETEVIGTVEVVRKDGSPIRIFNVKDKFTDTCTKVPADLPPKAKRTMESAALRLHKFTGCLDYNRGDFRMDANGEIYFLELNPLPSIDEESGFAKCCYYNGRNLGHVLESILYRSIQRFDGQSIQV